MTAELPMVTEEDDNFISSGVTYNCKDIYGFLILDKKIELTFSSAYEANRFRIRMHQVKTRTEKKFLDIGFMEKEEVRSMSFKLQSAADGLHTYHLSLTIKCDAGRKYSFSIVS